MIYFYLIVLLLLAKGIWYFAFPMSVWRWNKAWAEIRGRVMVDEPSPATIRFYRIWGFGFILFAVVAAIGFAIPR